MGDVDLDDEDRAILAEVAKKGYYHGRPKSEAIVPPVRIDSAAQPIVWDIGCKPTRAEFDHFQKKWDKFDDDIFLKKLEVDIAKQTRAKTPLLEHKSLNPLK